MIRSGVLEPCDAACERGDFLLYDNDCPFCSAYVRMLRLREAGVALALLPARENLDLVRHFTRMGYDVNRGMILKLDRGLFFGADAVHALAMLSSGSTLMNRLARRVFSSHRASVLLYPVMRAGRNLTLRLLGRDPIEA